MVWCWDNTLLFFKVHCYPHESFRQFLKNAIMDHSLLTNIVVYLAAAIVAVTLFRGLGLGAILGYLFAGAVIGPDGLHFIADPEHTLHFAEIGVVMLLFVIGLELNPEKLWQMRKHIMLLGVGQLLLSAGALALIFVFTLNTTPGIAVLLGLTLGLSSTAFALQLMGEHGIMGLSLGRKGFAILLLQDMAVIPILLLVGFMAPSQSLTHSPPWWLGPLAVLMVLLIGRFAINPLLRAVAATGVREILSAATLLIVLGTALLMQASGLTMGMGAFLAGIILGNSSFRHQLEGDIEPFKGLLLGLFFIAVGMSLDLTLLISEPLLIVGAALGLMLVKTIIIAGLVRLSGCHWRDAGLLGLILAQGGEFAFVVMTKSVGLELLTQPQVDRATLIVGVSMAFTAPLVIIYKRLTHPKPIESTATKDNIVNDEPEVIIAGFGRFGQITGRLLSANQLAFTALDKNIEHVEFVKKFGNRVFFGDATRPELLAAAGVAHARILVLAVDDPEASVTIAEYLQQNFPKLMVIARARDRFHAYKLLECGVEHVIRETFESSLVAATHTLEALGYTETQTKQLVDIFRNHDCKMLLRAVDHQDDVEKLIDIASEGRKELESLFAQDKR